MTRGPLTDRASPVSSHSGVRPAGPGEPQSIRQVFDEYVTFVWRTLRHLGVREADIPDVCQDVFIVVHRKLDDFEGRSKLQTWLYGICLRTASDYRRRAYHRRENAVAEVPDRVVPPVQEEGLAEAQGLERLLRLLDYLDEDKRQVFVLYEIEELEMKAIAELVGCPLQTAYSRLRAARKALADLVTSTGLKEAP